jgi:hypothetical protein
LKAIDTQLQKWKFLSLEQKNEIRQWFRAALYAVTEEDFAEAKSKLLTKYGIKIKSCNLNEM